MKLSLFGVGNAGVRIVDQLYAAQRAVNLDFTNGNVLTFTTTTEATEEAEYIPTDRCVLLGDTHPAVTTEPPTDTDEKETTESQTGVGGDPSLGVAVAREDLPEIRRALDMIDETEVDGAMVVVGLGGGTGCGVGAVLLEELQAIYETPVYVLGVLPAAAESDRRMHTAARAIRTFVPLADAVITVDNEAWQTDDSPVADSYDRINAEIATRIVSLFGAGEAESAATSEVHMDPSDIRRTLDTGGLASLGYAEHTLTTDSGGLLTWLRQLFGGTEENPADTQTDAATIQHLVGRTLGSKLTLPCDVSTADRVLLILSGPPEHLSRKGFETSRHLLEQETETVDVLAGDEPLADAKTVTATVLLSNVTSVPRIKAIQERAVAIQPEIEAQTDAADDYDHGFQFQTESEDGSAGRTAESPEPPHKD